MSRPILRILGKLIEAVRKGNVPEKSVVKAERIVVDEDSWLANSPEAQFILAVRKVAQDRLPPSDNKIFGLPVPLSTEHAVAKVLERSLINRTAIAVMNDAAFPAEEKVSNKFPGQVVSFSGFNAMRATEDEVRDASVIMIPGLGGGDNTNILHRTFKELRKLFPNISDKDFLIYSPTSEGVKPQERYYRGAMPYFDRGAINTEDSQNFFEEVFEKKFCDEAGKLLPAEQCRRLVILTHSIGTREAGSHVRFLRMQLVERGISDGEVGQYMKRILRVGVGSPLTAGSELGSTPSVTFFSMTDFGVKRPVEFAKAIDTNSRIFDELLRSSKLVITPSGGSASKSLVLLAPGVAGNGELVFEENGAKYFAANPLGHAVRQYVKGIIGNEQTKEIALACEMFANPNVSDEEAARAVAQISANAMRYPGNNKAIDEEGIFRRIEALAYYQRKEEDARANARKQRLVQAPLTSCDKSPAVPAPSPESIKVIEATSLKGSSSRDAKLSNSR